MEEELFKVLKRMALDFGCELRLKPAPSLDKVPKQLTNLYEQSNGFDLPFGRVFSVEEAL